VVCQASVGYIACCTYGVRGGVRVVSTSPLYPCGTVVHAYFFLIQIGTLCLARLITDAAELAHIAAGKPNVEIASSLFVSLSTVKLHINNLYRKLGAHSRTEALSRASVLDLL
jgi:DNA-binding CsgD family transcriptional regulator